MDKDYESMYHAAEDTQWWFVTRQNFVCAYLRKRSFPPTTRILDIGCGGGGMIRRLHSTGFTEVNGIDISPEAIRYAQSRNLTRVQVADAEKKLPFADASFDVIIASDVLEHIDDTEKALVEWARVLATGGIAIIFVPAFQWMWSHRDVVNHHRWRFTLPQLSHIMEGARFKIVLASYWSMLLMIPYFCVMQAMRLSRKKILEIKKEESFINTAMTHILNFENSLILHPYRLPFGISCVIIGEKH